MKRTARKSDTSTQPQVFAYVRVSTEEQARDGISLDAQKAKIQAWCDLNDAVLGETFVDEGISGHKMAKRPGLLQAIDAACEAGGVLVVYSLSRLARNTEETIAMGNRLAKAGADLVSLSEKIDTTSATGKMIFRLLASLAEFERDQIAERTTMALAYKKSQRERVGALPYGFQEGPDGKLIEHGGEQAAIATIRQYRAAGLSLRAIVVAAEKTGIVSRAGKPLRLTQIARILEKDAA
jgi:site-specific DNA recombinase